ncbi:glycosyltransferase family 2 protein [Flavobacterium sp. CYK-55]|uniref:glycosyltransferase family 2 protein n=1 Tax=Flavobacterium sp. CYK-55 TaxID=2835529 RepID=UPI001BCC54BD|nr:glycosyltransferase family 2 protein [Flavobacterium sp. CYK-55]MBS7786276.1 glycosyltransferase family 2 protein [Flavobacterium sp. CYK-55]
MQISVVILNYNVRYFLELCVLSVQKALQNIDSEIIVVDNCSPDDSCVMMRERFSEVKLIANKENSGFPKGNNIGVAQARGKYVCILNPDTVVAEDTFEKLLAFAEAQSDLGIVGCKLIDGTGQFLPESKRGIPTPLVSLGRMSGLYKWFPKVSFFGKYYAQHLTTNQTGKVDVLVGAFMLMKRELYQQLGGFDEIFFMFGEDIDLSYRSLLLGKDNYYFADTSVIHYKGESTVKDQKYLRNFQQAMVLFYKKHYKSAGFFNALMKLGSYIFSLRKATQKSAFKKSEIDEYWLLSNQPLAAQEVENLLGKKVVLFDAANENQLNSLTNNSVKNVEIIFDNRSWSFQSIIAFMQQNSNQYFTYKIWPQNAAFLIGSNSSIDRGEVIK